MLVGIWGLTGAAGTFWPIWPIITWGAALGIHAGVTAGLSTGSRQIGKRNRDELREAGSPVSGTPRSLAEGSRRKWVAVMFVDIVGSTGLNETLGDDAWHEVLMEHRSLVRDAVNECGGVEVGTAGDGVLARFDGPADAVLCAIDLQCEIRERNHRDVFTPQVRIGIHAGEAVHTDQDLLGRVVNLASRVADEARAGEILVTEPVVDEVGPDLAVEDRGLRALKGLDRPRHLLAVRWSADADDARTN